MASTQLLNHDLAVYIYCEQDACLGCPGLYYNSENFKEPTNVDKLIHIHKEQEGT